MRPGKTHWVMTALLAVLMGAPAAASSQEANPLPDPDGKPADMSKPVQVFILMGQSNMLGFGHLDGVKAATEKGLYPYLVDDAGEWTVRKDVRNVRVMCSGSGPSKTYLNDWMSPATGVGRGKTIGPEIGIGYHVGEFLDAPVLILKSCIGNRSLGYDLLPPSAVGTGAGGKSYEGNKDDPTRTPKPGGWYAGVQYDGDTRAAKNVLRDLNTYYPGARKFEIAGFFFWQGAKDLGKGGSAANYEVNLVHFIKDLRKDFNAPNALFVCATMGQERKGGTITDAQLAVDGRTGKYPEFRGNVATFYSNPVSKGGGANGHYGGNGETYMNVGEGMGRAMVELLKLNAKNKAKETATAKKPIRSTAKKAPSGPAWVGLRVKKEGVTFQVLEVASASPAARAGLVKGMQLFAINGRFPADVKGVREIVSAIGPRGRLKVTILRDGRESPLVITPMAMREGFELAEDGF